MPRSLLFIAIVLFILQACSSSRKTQMEPLTAEEMKKLDPQLHFLYENPSGGPADLDLDIVHREGDGASVGVKVFTSDVAKLRGLGITLQAVDSLSAVCHIDLVSLRRILEEPTVTKVQALKGRLPAK